MSRARHEDWQLLDLEPGADLTEVNKALRFRRSLYQPDALATYNLLDEEERTRMLDRIDDAYRRITGGEPPPFHGPQAVKTQPEAPVEPAMESEPDPRSEPGAVLRYHRRRRGLTLEQVAEETKIRPALLDQLEAERVDDLPAAVFVRGHVLQVARALGVADPNDLAARYLAKLKLD